MARAIVRATDHQIRPPSARTLEEQTALRGILTQVELDRVLRPDDDLRPGARDRVGQLDLMDEVGVAPRRRPVRHGYPKIVEQSLRDESRAAAGI